MKVHFDINHPAHINLFKNSIRNLKKEKHNICVTGLNRGKIPSIIKNEIHGVDVKIVGSWQPSVFHIILFAHFFRFFKILALLKKSKPDVAVSSGGISFGLALKISNIRHLSFGDDLERGLISKLSNVLCDKRFFPPIIDKETDKIFIYNCLKQWAYLSPKYFKPEKSVLKKMDLIPYDYIFIRYISGGLNYRDEKDTLLSIVHRLPNMRIILSLENKSLSKYFPQKWTILEEPVNHFHSLVYYSKLVISSGDSMAREASILGVPTIYVGSRDMKANQVMIDKGILIKCSMKELPLICSKILKRELLFPEQEAFLSSLDSEWIDLVQFINDLVLETRKINN